MQYQVEHTRTSLSYHLAELLQENARAVEIHPQDFSYGSLRGRNTSGIHHVHHVPLAGGEFHQLQNVLFRTEVALDGGAPQQYY